jgi:hypothetical protein
LTLFQYIFAISLSSSSEIPRCTMKRFLCLLAGFFFVNSSSIALAAFDKGFGDLGKPADYEETIKTFGHIGLDHLSLDYYPSCPQLPASFDWRDQGVADTPARDQGNCGSCWAFVSAGVLESRLVMQGFPEMDVSEQQQISCNLSQKGCCGGDMKGLQYWYTSGPMEENCTGYGDSSTTNPQNQCVTERNVSCNDLFRCPQPVYRTTGYYTVNTGFSDEMKASMHEDGPAFFRYDIYEDFPDFWNSGSPGDVYTQTTGAYLGGHGVLIIGWDDNRAAWLCKNSWGATEGPNGDGTFWIAYSGHSQNLNLGMASSDFEIYLTTPCTDNDLDGYYLESGCDEPLDCDDLDANIYPTNPNAYCDCQDPHPHGVTEICDGLDNDCDGEVDEGLDASATTCGEGACAATGLSRCRDGAWVDTCTPSDGSPEICDGVDNDCNGEVDDGLSTDADGDGYYATGSCLTPADDCDDSNPAVKPSATEGPFQTPTCRDTLDNDCDGLTDRDDSDCALACGTLPTAGSGTLGQMVLLLIPLAQIFLMKTLRRRKN